MVNEQRSFVDDLAFPRGCKFSSWLSSTRNWDLSWWMVLILNWFWILLLVVCQFTKKTKLKLYSILGNRTSTKWAKPNPMTIINEIQSTKEQSNILPLLQGIARDGIYYINGIPKIGQFQK